MFHNLQKVNVAQKMYDIYNIVIWCKLCQLSPFLLAQSHISADCHMQLKAIYKIELTFEHLTTQFVTSHLLLLTDMLRIM